MHCARIVRAAGHAGALPHASPAAHRGDHECPTVLPRLIVLGGDDTTVGFVRKTRPRRSAIRRRERCQ